MRSLPIARRTLIAAAAAVSLVTPLGVLAADNWPGKPITLIVPFAPGGTTDILGRIVAQKLGDGLHQTVVVDNKAGGGGTIGAATAARAPSDGYTIFLATIAHAIAPGLYKSLSYEFTRDFEPVGLVATTPNILIVHPSMPVKTVSELIAYCKAHPGQVNYGSAGPGSTEHLSGELFRTMTGTQMTHVPYKGGAPMMADLVAGQIQMAFETSPSAAPHIRAGKVRALAVTSARRSSAFADLPTVAEAGVPGYEMTTWFALMAPRGTPPAIVEQLRKQLQAVLNSDDVKARFAEQGVTPGDMPASQLPGFIRAETAKWAKIVKESGAKPE